MREIDPIGTNEALVGVAVIAVSHEGNEVTIVPGGEVIEMALLAGAPVTVLMAVIVEDTEELAAAVEDKTVEMLVVDKLVRPGVPVVVDVGEANVLDVS